MRTYVFSTQQASIEAWVQAGLLKVREGWTMARPLDKTIEVAPIPAGLTLRTYRYPEDNSTAVQAFNRAFADYYDTHPISEEAWAREMGAPHSRPDLSWLAFSDDGSVIGVAGCQVDESENRQTGRLEGWIEGIGVVPDYRRRGVGKALLTRCLQSLQSVGIEIALADVDSESEAAVGLFESCGFQVRSSLLQYECPLSALEI